MNAENVPDEGFVPKGYIDEDGNFVPVPSALDAYEQEMRKRGLDGIMRAYNEKTREYTSEVRKADLAKLFASPPPMSRIETWPNPHLPEAEFPRRPVAMTDAQREELQKHLEAGFTNFTEAVKGLVQVIGPAWQEMIDQVGKAFREISESFPDERNIHPGELRDERGIKQPSHTPPFWATTPGRTSKKRGKR